MIEYIYTIIEYFERQSHRESYRKGELQNEIQPIWAAVYAVDSALTSCNRANKFQSS